MIYLKLTKQLIEECSHAGECIHDVEAWLEVPKIKNQFKLLSPENIAAHLEGYGAWNEEDLSDHEMNKVRLLWVAAGNGKEEKTIHVYLDI